MTITTQQFFYCILYSTISIAAIGGNGIVIYLIGTFRRMRTVTNLFILNLAVGDLLMAVLCIPFTFTSNLLLHGWPFGSIMCRVVSYAQAVSVFISAYTLVAISVDRYIAILYPLRPRMTRRHSQYLIAFIWFVALITPLPTALLSRLVSQSALDESQLSPLPQTPTSDDQNDTSAVVASNPLGVLVSKLNLTMLDIPSPFASSPPQPQPSPVYFANRDIPQSDYQYGGGRDASDDSLTNTFNSLPLMVIQRNNSRDHIVMQPTNRSQSGDVTIEFISDRFDWNGFNQTSLAGRLVVVDSTYLCIEDWSELDYKSYYSVLLMALQYVLPFSVLVFTYSKIACVVWGKQTPGEAHGSRDAKIAASKRKMIKMMITCVATFTLCWLPFNILIVIGDRYQFIYDYEHIEYVWFACHWLAMSHASYNPIIYMWMNSRFRCGFKYVLKQCIPCVPTDTSPNDPNLNNIHSMNTIAVNNDDQVFHGGTTLFSNNRHKRTLTGRYYNCYSTYALGENGHSVMFRSAKNNCVSGGLHHHHQNKANRRSSAVVNSQCPDRLYEEKRLSMMMMTTVCSEKRSPVSAQTILYTESQSESTPSSVVKSHSYTGQLNDIVPPHTVTFDVKNDVHSNKNSFNSMNYDKYECQDEAGENDEDDDEDDDEDIDASSSNQIEMDNLNNSNHSNSNNTNNNSIQNKS